MVAEKDWQAGLERGQKAKIGLSDGAETPNADEESQSKHEHGKVLYKGRVAEMKDCFF